MTEEAVGEMEESGVGQASAESEEWTCGKGLAHHSAVPTRIAAYLAALSEILRTHLPTIDTSDAAGQAEWDAYRELADAYAALAERLGQTAARMGGYRDLAQAPHHEEALADPVLLEVFADFVEIETDLAALLQESADRDRAMLRSVEQAEP